MASAALLLATEVVGLNGDSRLAADLRDRRHLSGLAKNDGDLLFGEPGPLYGSSPYSLRQWSRFKT
jgi:hypothetical protein